jgi:hypothetical protein
MQKGIIKVTPQFSYALPIEPKGILSKWHNDYGVLTMEKCKIIWSNWGTTPKKENESLWQLIKAHYVFPS